MKDIFTEYFQDKIYDADYAKQCCSVIPELIKNRSKTFYPIRYRLVCIVSIIQSKKQSIRMASRGILDQNKDNFTEYCYDNGHFYVTGLLYGVYMN